LLERVERGETITISRHGKPVARLVPAVAINPRPSAADAIAAMVEFQKQEGPTLGGKITICDLINEAARRP
jgi:antitoxin (DNA-binding transcriptional repressor) of toxin-antitoxin stability system